MKHWQETIGESYYQYLANLDDLVLLMDEAHRYRASAGARAIDGLKPILGLELTATPRTVGARSVPFRNVIYQYNLGQAMADGFVKEPAVATRKDFDPKSVSEDELERIKLEDAVHYHDHVTVELERFHRVTGLPKVHPFILVVAQDTDHARRLRTMIESESFFKARFLGKVAEVHSAQRGLNRSLGPRPIHRRPRRGVGHSYANRRTRTIGSRAEQSTPYLREGIHGPML